MKLQTIFLSLFLLATTTITGFAQTDTTFKPEGKVLVQVINRTLYETDGSTDKYGMYINRANFVNQFYLHGINNPAAENFLTRNNIGYVVLTSIEGYSMKDLEQYPFLKIVYRNKDITMFKYAETK